jgi:hypothetical protein
MDFNIEDFLPKYPNVNNQGKDFMNPYPDFYNSIYTKKEFNELQLERTEEAPPKGGHYNHQKIIARFLSSYTLYNAILLDHDMGTGKSCTAFAAIEQVKETSNTFKGALILSRGPRILANLMKELAYVCTTGQYAPNELERNLTEKERKRRLTKLVSGYYKFTTFEKFAKSIANMTDKEVRDSYSNIFICIDEVHNLRIRDEAKNYKQIHRLLHVIKNSKTILMSGTPMKDDPSEIAAIANLILPMDKQLPTGEEFNRKFLDVHGTGLQKYYSVKPSKAQDFKNTVKGYMSYLKAMTSSVKVVYNGSSIGSLRFFNVYQSKMSAFQTAEYDRAYKMDVNTNNTDFGTVATKDENSTSGIYSNARQASLFVFPDAKFGKEGFESNFDKFQTTKFIRYRPKPALAALVGKTRDETLANVKKYSSIYGAIIESILENPKKLHFIYNTFVHGSGCIVFGKLLEMFGFKHANGTEVDSSRRYALLTGTNITPQAVERIIRRFNAPDNMNGDYIQIIIGSKILTEGITLKNVQSIHISTPHWNYSELTQAVARGIRLESHKDLIDAGIVPVVNVYQHVAIPMSKVPSLDLVMYELCEAKDISIKAIERLIKESAVDCALFYDRNASIGGVDGSRECDYQSCTYKCDGIQDMKPTKLDLSTYNLYYKSKTAVEIDISRLFKVKSIISMPELLRDLYPKYDSYDIFSEINNLIINNIIIKNSLDIDCYLREHHNILFLVDSITAGNDFFSNVYTSNPISTQYKDMESACDTIFLNYIKRGIDIEYCFDRLSFNMRRMMIETILSFHPQTLVSEAIKQHIKPFIKNDGKTYLIDDSAVCFKDGEWVSCEYKDDVPVERPEFNLIKEVDLGRKDAFKKFGYAGQYNIKNKKFCIEKLEDLSKIKDTRSTRTGKACLSWDKSDLIRIAVRIGIETNKEAYKGLSRDDLKNALSSVFDEDVLEEMTDAELKRARFFKDVAKKDNLCTLIRDFMAEHYLLYESDGCGVAGQTKKGKKMAE